MAKLGYLASGLTNRWGRPRKCPACSATVARVVDRKFFHTLNECQSCWLRYRYPVETPQQMQKFYQSAYQQKGITTDLPTPTELASLMSSRFKGTKRDASHLISLLSALGVRPGQAVLDFGASWGYYTWQLQQAGYQAVAFEISEPRAAYGKNLGLDIKTSLQAVLGQFQVVFSSHVLEHLPNPRQALQDMAALVVPGGFVVAFTPNGAPESQRHDPATYHRLWGKVHPVLITPEFVRRSRLFSEVKANSSSCLETQDFQADRDSSHEDIRWCDLLIVGRVSG